MRPFKRTRTVNGKRVRDKRYTIKYEVAPGKWKYETAYLDKEASEAMLLQRKKAVERGEQGFGDPFKDFRKLPLEDHLKAFLATIRAGGATERYVKKMETRLKYAFEVVKAGRSADLTMDRAERFVLHLRDAGRALATVNHYTSALKEFSRWGFERRRWATDSLVRLKRVNAEQDLRRQRRTLTPKDFNALLGAARVRAVTQYVRNHPTASEEKRAELRHQGQSRAIAYQLAALAGLRFNEIKTLTWADVDFDKAPGRITIRAKNAKSKREDSIPMCESLSSALMAWFETQKARVGRAPQPEERVLHVGSRFRDSFKSDCKWAEIKDKDASGRYFDMHALRHTFATWLAQANVHPKVAQELLRHTDVRLTLKHYTHTTKAQQMAALASLPTVENCAPKSTTDVTKDVTTAAAIEGNGGLTESDAGKTTDMQAEGQDRALGPRETGADSVCQPLRGEWRRGESNPRPEAAHQRLLRA